MSNLHAGYTYLIETIRDGIVVDAEVVHNLMPTQAINHMIATEFAAGAQTTTWYIGLFEGNYTPVLTDTAAAFPGAATECTTYAESTRVAFIPGAVAAGAVSNSASRAEFTSTADKTVYGGFMVSAAAKGAVSGTLASVVRFASAKTFSTGSVLRVTADFAITN